MRKHFRLSLPKINSNERCGKLFTATMDWIFRYKLQLKKGSAIQVGRIFRESCSSCADKCKCKCAVYWWNYGVVWCLSQWACRSGPIPGTWGQGGCECENESWMHGVVRCLSKWAFRSGQMPGKRWHYNYCYSLIYFDTWTVWVHWYDYYAVLS